MQKVLKDTFNNLYEILYELTCLFFCFLLNRFQLIELLGLLTGLELLELWRLIYPKLLIEFGMLVFFLWKSHGISGQIFGLTSSFLSNRWLQVALDGKSRQKSPVNAGVPQGSILCHTLFLLYINDLPDDVCDIALMTFLTMFSVILLSMLMIHYSLF